MPFRYLFGPVLSRRLGRSLGVDLVPLKTCTFNCVFCQLGRTSAWTVRRAEYVPVEDVIAELLSWRRQGGVADFVTLAGSGEPTLHSRFGRVLETARAETGIRSALLTNASLFNLPEVRRDAAQADLVKAALSAGSADVFRRVNRPHAGIELDAVLDGLRAFRGEFKGELWIEVFLVSGLNDGEEEVGRIAALARTIRPDRVHLNTVVRPPAEPDARAVPQRRLEELANLFDPAAAVVPEMSELEHSGDGGPGTHSRRSGSEVTEEMILGIIGRHPCSAEDVARSLGVPVQDVSRTLDRLRRKGRVLRRETDGRVCFVPSAEGAP